MELSPYDKERIVTACQRLGKAFNNYIKITFKESTLDLNSFDILKTPVTVNSQRMLHDESLLEEMVETSAVNIESLALTRPILYKEKWFMPIAMFCYDNYQKKHLLQFQLMYLDLQIRNYTREMSVSI
ncbi:MAG: hypothetical protein LBE70_01680 [Nitrososphaerota archaeon]|jgi:hypothetical protein|nr:hypothetical protein [Nitrososphaerota archaeon]